MPTCGRRRRCRQAARSGRIATGRRCRKTMDTKPAYDAYDEGRNALPDYNSDLAVEKANAAIRLYAEETHFYALRGDARFTGEQYDMAISNYDIAIRG